MKTKKLELLCATGLLLALVPIVVPQTTTPSEGSHRIRILRLTEPIKIDGRLDEPAWSQAEPATDFRQESPTEGAPASEKTEVRVLYDSKNIYIGIRAFDSEPAKINARDLVRDSTFSTDDRIEIVLDTYHDQRNAFRFAVNPLGTQQDALITDEGKNINLSWDSSWISAGRFDTQGYVVEIEIPLTTLRFTEGIDSWGFNVSRVIRRKTKRTFGVAGNVRTGLSVFRRLASLPESQRSSVAVSTRSNLTVLEDGDKGVPLVGTPGFDAGVNGKVGLEVAKIGITPSLTAEFTANPDFGQAEVDNQVVNLTRFSVFFPKSAISFWRTPASFSLVGEGENQAFFTRRIGLTDDGAPVPIDYGAKVTGRIGRYNVGFLQVQTRKLGEASTGFGIPRRSIHRAAGQARRAEAIVHRRHFRQSPGRHLDGRQRI